MSPALTVTICAAIVDVNLGGHDCSSICAALTKRSIPIMFYTGYSNAAPLGLSSPSLGNKI